MVDSKALEQSTFLADLTPLIEGRLNALIPSSDGPLASLHAAMRYSALAPGKRLRPALCLLTSTAVGGTLDQALDAACAIEFVHAFSLIHDDLPAIDNDDLRRGRPTCHVQFGEATAILAGDALFALAFEVIALAKASAEQRVEGMRILTQAVGSEGLVGGEMVDVLSEGQPIDIEKLRFIHSRKTGALIAAACSIGALFGGGSKTEIENCHEFGRHIGLAFQIADDVLNITSTPEKLGKAAGSDQERQKATYPAFFGLDESIRLALEEADKGIACIEAFRNSEPLKQLARFSVQRLH